MPLETRVLSATPIELVQMLYDGAIDSIQCARRHLAEGRIRDRGRSIGKAIAILAELKGFTFWNYEKGGELSTLLGSLGTHIRNESFWKPISARPMPTALRRVNAC